jgi:hypothetical protein
VNAIDRRNQSVLEFVGNDLVCGEHALLDELVRDVVLNLLQPHRAALVVEPDFYFREIEI